ncbi:type IV pilus assembly protein PilM [Patescibacteria group bacterium]|nr:type IV pilus assembly protein PilM [Patescibacteria group bacterium]
MPALNHFGLDIGSHSIKAVQLSGPPERPIFIASGQIESPTSATEQIPSIEDEQAMEAVANSIKTLHKEAHFSTDKVIAALPESQIFTRVIELPSLKQSDIKKTITWEAEQYVPVPMSEVRLDWQVLGKVEGGKVEVLLVAAPIALVESYLKIIRLANLTPISLETEITSVVRSLVQRVEGTPSTMVVSIGASTTDLSIVNEGRISFTRSIGTGGYSLARGVAQELGFEIDQATEYMKTYGLDPTSLEGKVMQAIKPIFDVIVNEIRRVLAYYSTNHPNSPVKRLIVTGGTAKLPGLVIYLAEALGLEVQVGNPWEGISLPPQASKKLMQDATSYAVAVGLALKQSPK